MTTENYGEPKMSTTATMSWPKITLLFAGVTAAFALLMMLIVAVASSPPPLGVRSCQALTDSPDQWRCDVRTTCDLDGERFVCVCGKCAPLAAATTGDRGTR